MTAQEQALHERLARLERENADLRARCREAEDRLVILLDGVDASPAALARTLEERA